MILASAENVITYRCPICGSHVLSMIGVFKLSGDLIKLKCSCGGSKLAIARQPGRKIKLSVPCLFCDEAHSYTMDREQFFSKKAFSLTCPVTGLDVCCIGDENSVREYAEQQDEKLNGILRDCGFESLEEYLTQTAGERLGAEDLGEDGEEDESEENLLDESDVISAVPFILTELEEEHAIHCGCPDGEGEYDYTYQDGILQVFCRKCAAEADLPMRTGADLHAWMELESLDLEGIAVINFDDIPDVPDPED